MEATKNTPHLGEYTTEFLGSGGFSFVYSVQGPDLDVAVKILGRSPVPYSYEVRAQDAFSRVTGGGAPSYLGHVNFDGLVTAIVMERIRGVTLQSANQQNLDPYKRLKSLRDALQDCSVAWREGIVHRDLKPANIILPDGEDTNSVEPVKILERDEYPTVIDYLGPNNFFSADTVLSGSANRKVDYVQIVEDLESLVS